MQRKMEQLDIPSIPDFIEVIADSGEKAAGGQMPRT